MSNAHNRPSVFRVSFDEAKVADVLRPGIVSCPPETPAVEVARMMATHHVHSIFVMHPAQDDSREGYVWGIISDLDLVRAGLEGRDAKIANDLARTAVVSVKPSLPLREAGQLMVKHGVSHLAVVDGKTLQPVGVLSTTDVAGVLAWGEG
jgi:CBS domain-containing protein